MMGAPQIIMTVLIAMGVGISLTNHGHPKGVYGVSDWLISPALTAALLYWGGFWG